MLLDDKLTSQRPQASLSLNEIFKWIWTRPRYVFTVLHRTQFDTYSFSLIFLAAWVGALGETMNLTWFRSLPLFLAVLMIVIFGGLIGALFTFLYCHLLSWTGKWLGGNASFMDMARSVAYASIPAILSMITFIPFLFMFGLDIYKPDFAIESYGYTSQVIANSLSIIEIVLSLWGFVMLITGVAVAQHFNYFKAFVNIMMPVLLFVVPIAFLISLVYFSL